MDLSAFDIIQRARQVLCGCWSGGVVDGYAPPYMLLPEIEYKDQSRIGGSRGRNNPNRILLKLYVEAILKYW